MEGETALRDRHEQLLARLRLREEAEISCWRQYALLLYMVDKGHLRAHGYPYLAELGWEVEAGVPQYGVACSVFVDEQRSEALVVQVKALHEVSVHEESAVQGSL